MIIKAWGAADSDSSLQELTIKRRPLLPEDILIEIIYCGVCHSDIHMCHDDWGMSVYPVIPGHEIIGKVIGVGEKVNHMQLGQIVGVGCMVDACCQCASCHADEEMFCQQGMIMTYGSQDPHMSGKMTYGGYASHIVVNQHFVLSIPDGMNLAATAPLLCAGITTYSPLINMGAGPDKTVGIIGLGGLGHLGIKFSKALGAKTHVISQSESKIKKLSRRDVDGTIMSNTEQMQKHIGQFGLLIDTISAPHDINRYLPLLKQDGTIVLLGATPVDLHSMHLIFGRKNITGSLIGGIKQTQEMLNFASQHQIYAETELIQINQINSAYERVMKQDVHYRFVIDMRSIHN